QPRDRDRRARDRHDLGRAPNAAPGTPCGARAALLRRLARRGDRATARVPVGDRPHPRASGAQRLAKGGRTMTDVLDRDLEALLRPTLRVKAAQARFADDSADRYGVVATPERARRRHRVLGALLVAAMIAAVVGVVGTARSPSSSPTRVRAAEGPTT